MQHIVIYSRGFMILAKSLTNRLHPLDPIYLEIIFKALQLSTDVAVHAFCYSFHSYITTIPHHDHAYIYKVRANKNYFVASVISLEHKNNHL